MTKTLTLKESNAKLNEYLCKEKPFMICRVSDNATKLSLHYTLFDTIQPQFKERASKYDGVYFDPLQNDSDAKLYAKVYYDALKEMSLFACFPHMCIQTQNAIIKHCKVAESSILHNRVLEPYYLMHETNFDVVSHFPWTHHLHNKRVLIISPFVDTYKNQVEKGCKFFGKYNPNVWAPNQEFVYYKCYNTLYDNHPHKNWFETFSIMCKDIAKLDFDVALLSCGGYGLPLCRFIYKTLGKTSIYIWVDHYNSCLVYMANDG